MTKASRDAKEITEILMSKLPIYGGKYCRLSDVRKLHAKFKRITLTSLKETVTPKQYAQIAPRLKGINFSTINPKRK